jgi:glutamate-1-semialdehyde 2,1-aminomutase
MGSLFFNPGPVVDFDSAAGSDSALFTTYFKAMLEQGIYLAPSPFEAAFVSTAHSEDVVDATLECAARAFEAAARRQK